MPNPDKPLSADTPKNPTDNNLVIGLVLAGVVAFLILAGAMFFNFDKRVRTRPQHRRARSFRCPTNRLGGDRLLASAPGAFLCARWCREFTDGSAGLDKLLGLVAAADQQEL